MPEMYQISFQLPYTNEWRTRFYDTLQEAEDAVEFYNSFTGFPAQVINVQNA